MSIFFIARSRFQLPVCVKCVNETCSAYRFSIRYFKIVLLNAIPVLSGNISFSIALCSFYLILFVFIIHIYRYLIHLPRKLDVCLVCSSFFLSMFAHLLCYSSCKIHESFACIFVLCENVSEHPRTMQPTTTEQTNERKKQHVQIFYSKRALD